MKKLSPIVLFTYKRIETLRITIERLSENILASESDLIIYSDGPMKIDEIETISNIRSYLKSVTGFKSITIHESDKNLGLANSIINGISEIFQYSDKVIVLEDDLITSKNFLLYMNQGLDFFQSHKDILSICGYSPPLTNFSDLDFYYTQRSSSWGWGTWSDRWTKVDWKCEHYRQMKYNPINIINFNKMGSDLSWMLWKQMHGQINSWAIRFCFHQFNYGLYSIHPRISKVQNIGVGDTQATNTKGLFTRFETNLDDGDMLDFHFYHDPKLNCSLIKQFVKPNSICVRLRSKFNI